MVRQKDSKEGVKKEDSEKFEAGIADTDSD
jgi:hypothetical protein